MNFFSFVKGLLIRLKQSLITNSL